MAKIQNRRQKSAALVVAAGLTVAGTGVAYAYWTALGSGDGNATTGESVAFVIEAADAVGADLSPGGAPQTVAFTVTNPGDGAQFLNGVTVTVANPTTAFVSGDCSAADYTVTMSTPPPVGQIAAGAEVDGVATISMNNLATNQDDCQGVDVPLHFVAGDPVVS